VRGKQSEEYEVTLRAIQCVTFFGAPHMGMSIEYLEPITRVREHESMRRILEDLRPNSELLRTLRATLADLQQIAFITCLEQRRTLVQVSTVFEAGCLSLYLHQTARRRLIYRKELPSSWYKLGQIKRAIRENNTNRCWSSRNDQVQSRARTPLRANPWWTGEYLEPLSVSCHSYTDTNATYWLQKSYYHRSVPGPGETRSTCAIAPHA